MQSVSDISMRDLMEFCSLTQHDNPKQPAPTSSVSQSRDGQKEGYSLRGLQRSRYELIDVSFNDRTLIRVSLEERLFAPVFVLDLSYIASHASGE